MSSQEGMNFLRQILTFGGALLTGHGIATAPQVSQAVTDISTIIPALVSLGSIAWSVYAHWNMKKVPDAAKVVGALALFGMLALLSIPSAYAADLNLLKAPSAPGYPAAGGFYFGLGASSTAASATVANTGILAAGAGVDGVFGYQWKGGLDFIAPEVDLTYINLGNSGACPVAPGVDVSCSANDRWEVEPLVKFGFPLSTIMGVLPSVGGLFPALPALPSNLALNNTTQHPYVYAGAPIRDDSATYGVVSGKEWLIQPEIGAGILSQWQQGLVVDVRAGCSIGHTGFNLSLAGVTGPQPVSVGTSCQSRLEFLY